MRHTHTCWQLALKNSHCGKADHCPQRCSSALKMCGSFENSVISLSALNVRTDFFPELTERFHLTGCRNQIAQSVEILVSSRQDQRTAKPRLWGIRYDFRKKWKQNVYIFLQKKMSVFWGISTEHRINIIARYNILPGMTFVRGLQGCWINLGSCLHAFPQLIHFFWMSKWITFMWFLMFARAEEKHKCSSVVFYLE